MINAWEEIERTWNYGELNTFENPISAKEQKEFEEFHSP